MLSSASKHALVILQYLARQDGKSFHSVSEIAKSTETPSPYLSKLVKELSWLGILESKRGAGGGIRLSDKAKKLSIYDLCEAMKDPVVKQECVLRNAPCNPNSPCSFHKKYGETRKNLLQFLRDTRVTTLPT
ncbi:MAG: Rrf2 family transcriptional regulator [Bdellovibrionales bacterium]|nr:Rrf2 family transcriptional regulator [Bdellovibrionales bacterium]